jgi:hypothetical protein
MSPTKWAVYIPSEKKAYVREGGTTADGRARLWWTTEQSAARAKAEHVNGKVVDADWLVSNFDRLVSGVVALPEVVRA